MPKRFKIYLDVCCLNRPFDNWQQDRVRFEGEAVLSILERVRDGQWQMVSSEAIEAELARLSNPEKLAAILPLIDAATTIVALDDAVELRSQFLEKIGFSLYDSFHIACAEAAQVDVLLTTDDRLLRRTRRCQDRIQIIVDNPVTWLMRVLQEEANDDDTS